eukprot:CAMPEP_0194316416 /NCGR_PEP_ID=MMETSP0171-20130528/13218_1 /TAXON_ID=218684 /ORGANISM="Corethron pennatum, Strain L29A3" /LENGTH=101 /DNA_ID=CAMNT_0039072639 /DNA_START=484 /DNA_END=789 /DNA_ORIENTATION=-
MEDLLACRYGDARGHPQDGRVSGDVEFEEFFAIRWRRVVEKVEDRTHASLRLIVDPSTFIFGPRPSQTEPVGEAPRVVVILGRRQFGERYRPQAFHLVDVD